MSDHAEKPLSDQDVEAFLAKALPDWRRDGAWIERRYETHGWKGSLMVANLVGHLAEAGWHHPDLHVSWGGVLVRLQTHSASGITAKDFALAHKIEEVVLWRPELDGSPLEGVPHADPRFAYLKHST
jgi:4a-hydroxytetrahydrobiopterin dehydratase